MEIRNRVFSRSGFVITGVLSFLMIGLLPAYSVGQSEKQPPILQDQGWPRQVIMDGNRIIVHQPQIEKWDNYVELLARVAVSVTPQGASAPIVGSAHFKADTQTNFAERNVLVYNKQLVDTTFQGQDEAVAKKMEGIVRKIQGVPEIMSLDRVLAYLEKDAAAAITKPQTTKSRISNMPPVIFASRKTLSILVILDGDPILVPIKDSDLTYAVNTNWDLFQSKSTKQYYLRHNDVWLKAANFRGP